MRSIIRYIRKRRFTYSPLVEITLSKENLLHNLSVFQKKFHHSKIATVLKSNAYGHGLVEIAKILDEKNLPFFAVDSYHEALILRNEDIRTPLLVIGYARRENITKCRLKNISWTIVSIDQLKNLAGIAKPAHFHLKIDTGMGRQGIQLKDIPNAIALVKENPKILIDGIMTHLADAECENEIYTSKQAEIWRDILEKIKKEMPKIQFFHASNTAGYFYENLLNGNVARVGIGLYGIHPNPKRDQELDLKPVLEMKTMVTGVKEFERGQKIGYNGTFEVKNPMKIATIPVGYSEGIDRGLSNAGFVKIKNEFCPIVGRVSMNITTVDVTKIPIPLFEREVTVISREREDKNSIENMARTSGKIPYEILVHIPSGIRRKVV